jgi:hypothetical protein
MPTQPTVIDTGIFPYGTPHQVSCAEAVNRLGSGALAAAEIGVSKNAVNDSISRMKANAARAGYAPECDLIHPVAPGQKLRGASLLYRRGEPEPLLTWVKSSADEQAQAAIMREAFAAMSEDLPRVAPVAPPVATIDALCNLVVFTDYHLGQLSWHKEGGADWDLKIAESMLLNSFIHMVESAPKASACVLCLQGDFLHTDGLLPLTPAHKNVLDADGRFSKIVATAIRVIRQLIAYALAKHDSLHLIICEGNHDEAGSMWLRQMFAAMYEREPRMTVNDSELPFYVHQHGDTMLAFHHGHKVKNEQLPMLFAAQYSKMWGATSKRYAHCGHRHHIDEKEYAGMSVTQHPTLAARDAHASRGGWISDRAANVITYHKRFGQVGRTIVCPEMFEVQ